ncbi:hydrogenase maturation nickel metallochaperone HypA [Shewanella chilikensis]|uniref:Hydrogenase maturation factor HypA n=1 Tax=Shewanella chilikensis TaxID=558541 RepID=A0A6G7LPR7_9GAMM|nr:hydrogenase maturation nickel metallochaperone HypA [Shewanella chilikensis]QIJ03704.1 hydrogenase maturation nickel metallochaperone HypA [Shewanella chilikensis]
MHEAAITEGLVRTLLTEAARHQISSIKQVTVKVGQLKAVEPHALKFCFEMFVEGTIAENAKLIIVHLTPIAICQQCSTKFEVPKFHFRCPQCDSNELKLQQGEELFIESFDV